MRTSNERASIRWIMMGLAALTLVVGACRQGGADDEPDATPAATLSSISVQPESPSIAFGLSQSFTAMGSYSDGSTRDLTASVTWTSSDAQRATIADGGIASSVGEGTATISASQEGVTGTTELTVTPAAVVSVAVTPETATLPVGATQQLTATATFSDGSTQDVTTPALWSTRQGIEVSIGNTLSDKGLATALREGTAGITALYEGVRSNIAVLTLTAPALVSIAISPADPTVALAASPQFTATATYTNGSTVDLTDAVLWTSSNEGIATIGNGEGTHGLADPVAVGTATIGVEYEGTEWQTTSLTVAGHAWTATAPAPFDIVAPVPVGQDAEGRILVMNTADPAESAFYDPATGQWSAVPSPPFAGLLEAVAVAPLPDHKVLVAGGYIFLFDEETQEIFEEYFATASIFDMNAGTWTPTTSMSRPRRGAEAVALSDGRVLVFGGADGFLAENLLRDGELYDPVTGTWTSVGETSIDLSVREHAIAALPDGRVFMTLGSTVEVFDPATGSWTIAASPGTPRRFATATPLADGRVLLAGGVPLPFGAALSSAEIYDPSEDEWAATGSLNISKWRPAATRLSDGRVLISGGQSGFISTATSHSEIFDPASGSWSNDAGNMVRRRGGHRLMTLNDGRVFAIGDAGPGDDDANRIAELWQ
ncbi:MAG: Ig-like domain-containing protein [Myxococcota bacterium]